jgi:hypothetical protein
VEKQFEKANKSGASGNLSKAIGLWWLGYDEARSNGLGFPYKAFFPYTALLAEAGFGEDAMALLCHLRNHRRSSLPASPKPADLLDYYRELAAIHSAMARALALSPTPLTAAHQGDIVFHLLLTELSEQSGLLSSGYGTEPYPLTVNRMQEILRQAKLNKKSRPEEAQQLLVKHWYTVPKIDVRSLREEVVGLISTWLASSDAKSSVTGKPVAAQAAQPREATIPTAIPVPSPAVPPPVWFVIRGDKQFGPFSSRQLRELATSGKVVPEDLVRRSDMDRPTSAKRIKGLFPPPTK